MASSSNSGNSPTRAKRQHSESSQSTILIQLHDQTGPQTVITHVDWDPGQSFEDFKANKKFCREGVQCFMGSERVNFQLYADNMREGKPVYLYVRVEEDLQVDEPVAAQQELSRPCAQLVMREDISKLKKQNEATLKQYPSTKRPVKFKLRVDGAGEHSGTLLLRWSEDGLNYETGVPGLVNGAELKGSVLRPKNPEDDGEYVDLAAATVLCALWRSMGKSKPKFELELFAGEQGQLPELHERLVRDADVIVVELTAAGQDLLLVPVNAIFDDKEPQLFLGYVAPLGALNAEYRRLINEKIPVVIDLDGTLGCKPEDKHAIHAEYDRDEHDNTVEGTYISAEKKVQLYDALLNRKLAPGPASRLREQKNKWVEAMQRWTAYETLRDHGFHCVEKPYRKFMELHGFERAGGRDFIFLRPHAMHFLKTLRADFDPFIVTAASSRHAEDFLKAIESSKDGKGLGAFFKGSVIQTRLFCTLGEQKSLAKHPGLSTLSTIIIDDCSDGHGYVDENSTWAETDTENIWRIEAWTPLLKEMDEDVQLEFLSGLHGAAERTQGSAHNCTRDARKPGTLHRCRDAFLLGLRDASKEMRRKSWYDASASSHLPIEAVKLRGINYYLKKVKDQHDRAMRGGAEQDARASRSPSPCRGGEIVEPFWIIPDTSSLIKQAGQYKSQLGDFEELYHYLRNLVKIFVPVAVQEEITNHGKAKDPRLYAPARVISAFNFRYSKNGFVVFEEEEQGDRKERANKPAHMNPKDYRDHRIIKSAERKRAQLEESNPGKINCVLLSNDMNQTTEVFATTSRAVAKGRRPLHAITLAQLQCYMYNISKFSVRENINQVPCALRRGEQLAGEFFDAERSGFGIHNFNSLPESIVPITSYKHGSSFSIADWVETLYKNREC